MDVISPAAAIGGLVQLTTHAISVCRDYYKDVKNARVDIERLISEIKLLQHVLEALQKMAEGPSASKIFASTMVLQDVTHCSSELQSLVAKLEPDTSQSQSKMRRFGFRALKWPFSKKEIDSTVNALERHKSSFNTALSLDQTAMAMAAEQERNLAKLATVEGAAFNSYRLEHEPICLPNTRVDLLDQIRTWRVDSSQHIFWLSGMAGTGKSTIARTVAREFAEAGTLGGSFFFTRGAGDLGRATKFFSTIAVQLTKLSLPLKGFISEAAAEHEDISQQFLSNQWKQLIFESLKKLDVSHFQPLDVAIVIDALDECENETDVRIILRLLAQVHELKRNRIRFFVTSRPEQPIRLGFDKMDQVLYKDLVLEDVSQAVIEHDISVFLKDALARIREDRQIPATWPDQQDIQKLVEKSGSLFIYAATACRFVAGKRSIPQERLNMLLADNTSKKSATRELDALYAEVLKNCVSQDDEEDEKISQHQRFRQIVGSIVVLLDILSSPSLASLLDVEIETVDLTLNSLHCVLKIPSSQQAPIRLLHPSFRDFLTSSERCSDQAFFIEDQRIHCNLAKDCLRVMSKSLKKDICHLIKPGTLASEVPQILVSEKIPYHLTYACCYWVEHIEKAGPKYWSDIGLKDDGSVHYFFRNYYVFWLEVLSLLGEVSRCANSLLSLEAMSKKSESEASLKATVYDAKRFFFHFRTVVELAPLQIYCSALLFSPTESITKKNFETEISDWVSLPSSVESVWDNVLHNLDAPFYNDRRLIKVISMDLAKTYNLLASGYTSGEIRIWDVDTGKLVSTIEGDEQPRWTIAFSNDGQLIASGSSTRSIFIWDTATGAILARFPLEQSRYVGCLIFSTDDKYLISGGDKVNIWDLKCNALRYSLLHDPDSWIKKMSISHGSTFLAVLLFSDEHGPTARIYNLHTSTLVHTYACPEFSVELSFSMDDRFLVLGAPFEVLCWDIAKGTRISTEERYKTLLGMTFNLIGPTEDNKMLILAQRDAKFEIFDLFTGITHSTFSGYSIRGFSAIITKKHDLLAILDNLHHTLSIWSVHEYIPRQLRQAFGAHYASVRQLVLSHDARRAVSISNETTLRIWDVVEGKLLHDIEHSTEFSSGFRCSVRFSNDDETIASSDWDDSVTLWNVHTGKLLHRFQLAGKWVQELTFSHDNKLLASAVRDLDNEDTSNAGIAVHNILTGTEILRSEPFRTDFVRCLEFSEDDKFLIVVDVNHNGDGGFMLWSIDLAAAVSERHSFHYGNDIFAPFNAFLNEVLTDTATAHRAEAPRSGKLPSFPEMQRVQEHKICNEFHYVQYDSWVTKNGHRILWLPGKLRSYSYAIQGDTIVLGSHSGRITMLRFGDVSALL